MLYHDYNMYLNYSITNFTLKLASWLVNQIVLPNMNEIPGSNYMN